MRYKKFHIMLLYRNSEWLRIDQFTSHILVASRVYGFIYLFPSFLRYNAYLHNLLHQRILISLLILHLILVYDIILSYPSSARFLSCFLLFFCRRVLLFFAIYFYSSCNLSFSKLYYVAYII